MVQNTAMMAAAFAALAAVSDAASCTNACNGKGLCTFNNMCVCNERYTGGDCSLRKCPQHLAWADGAFADESAHAMYQTCSRMGHCDYTSGQCQCQPTPPFGGSDCRQLRCEKGCGGHGRCLTMEEHAAENGLVYDGRLVVDDQFRTTDPAIYAGGTACGGAAAARRWPPLLAQSQSQRHGGARRSAEVQTNDGLR